MEIGAVGLAPAVELDPQLDGGLGLAHELGLVEVDQGVEILDGRHRGLADADDADVRALDQRDGRVRSDRPLDRGRRHPAGGAAADDQDRFDRFCHGACSALSYCRIISRAVITRMISLVPSRMRCTRRSRTIRSSG